ELGDGPAAQRVLPELDRMAEWLRQPAVRLAALSRRSTLAALTGDFAAAAENARQAFQTGQAAALPDAGAVYWGQLFAIWLHAGACVWLGAAGHAPRVYQALTPYAGRAAVAPGAVMCSGSTDFYLAGLAALSGDAAAADRHYRAAASMHRRLGARPMLAHTLH